MRFVSRPLLVVACSVGGLVVALSVALSTALWLGGDRLKPRFESAASAALRMQVHVDGHLRASLGRRLLVSAENVRVLAAQRSLAASAQSVRLWIEPLPLLGGTVRLHRIEVVRPAIDIEGDGSGDDDGVLHQAIASLCELEGASLSLTGATVHFSDSTTGAWMNAENVGLTLNHLRFADRKRPLRARDLELEARFTCSEIRTRDLTVSAISALAKARDGVFELAPIRMHMLGGQGAGSLRADVADSIPRFDVRFSLAGFRGEQLSGMRPPRPVVSGPLGLTMSLTTTGATPSEWTGHSAGTIRLRGRRLTLVGDDLDRRLSRFESTQGFNFVDVGAAVLAGPIGLAVTRSYSVLGLFRSSGQDSGIEELVSDWVIDRGVAHARDVAMSTRHHRLALQGDLDFVHQRFVGVSVAVVAPGGCARAVQEMHGSFAHPVLEKPRLLTSLAGPVFHLYRQVRGLLPARPCTVYYSGSVLPPTAR